MKVGLNNRQRLFLSLFLCVVFIGGFLFVMKITLWKNINSLKTSNRDLQTQYDTLIVYVTNENQYRQDSIDNTNQVLEIAKNFDGGMNKKQLLHEFDNIFEKYGIESTSLSLEENIEGSVISIIDPETSEYKEFVCQKTPISISYSMTYKTFKEFFRDLKSDKIKISVEDISISPDETSNRLNGTMTLSWATIIGNKEFKDPVYTGPLGIDSIFRGLDAN